MIDQFLRYLEYEKRYSPHTIQAYREDINSFTQFISQTFDLQDIRDVAHVQVRAWIVELVESGNSPRTVNRKVASLKSLFKFLLSREQITQNPTSRVRPLKTDKKLPQFVKEKELDQLFDQEFFSIDFAGLRDQLILALLYASGARLAELIGIRLGDVDLFNGTIKVLGKRNKERVIPLTGEIVNNIKTYLKIREQALDAPCEYLLVTDSGKKMYPVFVQRKVKSYLSKVTTLSKKSPHVLRHTVATHLLNNGADLNAVKDLLGHANLAATQVYTHNTLEKLKSTFDQAHPKA
ncbi:MAG: tyrosine-type recombinase/integrase [Cyclobacteriaceae bacterium]